jgi:hypothetical protein
MQDKSMDRRFFLSAGIASLLGLPLFFNTKSLLAQVRCLPKQIAVPAAHMKARSDFVRLDFVNTHLNGGQPYQLAKAFHTSSMLPTDTVAAQRLLTKGDGYLRLNAQGVFSNGKASDSPVNAPFDAALCGVTFKVSASFPGLLQVKATYVSEVLTFEVVSPKKILFTLLDNLPNCGPLIDISLKQNLDKVIVSPSSLIIQTSSFDDSDCRFTLKLDYTQEMRGLWLPWHEKLDPFV